MKRSFLILIAVFVSMCLASPSFAQEDAETKDQSAAKEKPVKEAKDTSPGGNFSVGLGPVGNIYIVDSRPELGPGVGGYTFFDYRWSPQFSTQFGVLFNMQDGKGISSGDNDVIFMGIPTFDLKFYVLSNPSRWDPYALIGMGLYVVTEGSQSNGTKAVGVGANLGLGTDFYVTEKFSIGLAGVFRSIGLIDSTNGSNNGTALFPFSMLGNIAYHF